MTNREIAARLIAAGWQDWTSGNDACDYMLFKDQMQLAICPENPEDRECEGWARFCLTSTDAEWEPDYDTAAEFESFEDLAARLAEAALCEEWVRECEARGLPMWSADEVLHELEPTDPNYAYVSDFILRWEQSHVER